MAKIPNIFNATKNLAKQGASSIDPAAISQAAGKAAEAISSAAKEAKASAAQVKDDIESKITELDRMLEESITAYNDAFTLMNDKGVKLFVERSRAVDSIAFVEALVNSIANRPKTFDADFEQIGTYRDRFTGACEFAERELQNARHAAAGAGAGLAAGASVAFMAPTAAMWVATTFGVASTGTAISTLSGVAATNAALAWLGGGALAAGGGGVVAGNALLALAGPIGWTIAGATLLSSVVLFAKNRIKLDKQKNEEIDAVKTNTEAVREVDAAISDLLCKTNAIRVQLNDMYVACLELYGRDYSLFTSEQKAALGAIVNNTKSLSALFAQTVDA